MRTLCAFIFLLCSFSGFGQKSCNAPVPITSLPYSASATTCDGTANYRGTPCTLAGEGYAYYYTLSFPKDTCINIFIKRTGGSKLKLRAAVVNHCSPAACLNAGVEEIDTEVRVSVCLAKNTVYDLVVFSDKFIQTGENGFIEECAPFTINVTSSGTGVGSAPCEDEVIQALPFTDNNQNSCDGDRLLPKFSCGNGKFPMADDYIYRYTVKPGETCITVTFEAKKGNVFGGAFSDCPAFNNCVVTGTASEGGSITLNFDAEPGKTYYFLGSSAYYSLDNCANFNLTITGSGGEIENCPNAEEITGTTYKSSFNFRCKSFPYIDFKSCYSPNQHDAIFFKLSSPGNQCFSARVYTGSGGYIPNPTLYKGCPTEAGAVCLGDGKNYSIDQPGDYYYVVKSTVKPNYGNYSAEFAVTNESGDQGTCAGAVPFPYFPVADSVIVGNCSNGVKFDCAPASSNNPRSLTYSFQVPATGCYDLECDGLNGVSNFVLSENCVNGSSTCINGVNGKDYAKTVSMRAILEAGKTYYLTVSKATYLLEPLHTFVRIFPTDQNADSCASCTQNTCTNCQHADVESSYFKGWEGYTGTFTNRLETPGIPSAGINGGGAISIVSGDWTDTWGDFPVVNPNGGKYSFKLGDDEAGAKSSTLRFKYNVDSDAELFTYYYAVVLEDPNHTAAEQPGFDITAFDPNGDTIYCANYSVTARAGILGFLNRGRYRYKPWSAVAIPVKPYRGQEITLQFQVRDCSLGDHKGYAYLDAGCSKPGPLTGYSCNGQGGKIIGPEGFISYLWSNGATTKDLSFTTPGNYTLRAKTYTDCDVDFVTQITDIPKPNISTHSITNCSNTDAILIGDIPPPEYTYGWQLKPDSVGTDDTVVMHYPAPGNFSANYIVNREICSFTYPESGTIVNLATITMEPDTICFGDSVTYSIALSDPAVQVSWFDANTSKTRTFKTAGNYPFTYSKSTCSAQDSVELTVTTPLPFDLGPDIHVCEDNVVKIGITTTPYDSIRWSGQQTAPIITATASGKYLLRAFLKTCSFYDSVQVLIDTIPAFSLPADPLICSNTLPYLIPTSDGNASTWQDNSVTAVFTAQAGGLFFATRTNGLCNFRDSMLLAVQPLHYADLPKDTTICQQEILQITAQTDAQNPEFNWTPNYSTQSIQVSQAALYRVLITDGPCSASDSMRVNLVNRPFVNLGADVDTCTDISVRLSALSYTEASYLWNTGDTVRTIYANTPGTYSVVITRANCSEGDAIDIRFQAPPAFALGADFSLCTNEAGTIDATFPNATAYSWNTGERDSILTVHRAARYWVRVTVPPCIVSDTIQVLPLAAPELWLRDTALCAYDSLIIGDLCATCTYLWSTGQTDSMIWAKPGMEYQLAVVNSDGCRDSAQMIVSVEDACPELYVPNCFTIDNDGLNEVFRPVSVEMTILKLEIYNRWGELIASIPGPDPGWNGNRDWHPCKTDVYEWRVIYTNPKGEKGSKMGHVTLLR
ncbi:MAG: gliding motility-associated C-terminal domain-containing protein [Bacteroidota bacterium]